MVNMKALCEPKMISYRLNVIMGTSSVLSSTSALTPRNRDLSDHWGLPGHGDGSLSLYRERKCAQIGAFLPVGIVRFGGTHLPPFLAQPVQIILFWP